MLITAGRTRLGKVNAGGERCWTHSMEKHDGDIPDRRDCLGYLRDWLRLGRAVGPRLKTAGIGS